MNDYKKKAILKIFIFGYNIFYHILTCALIKLSALVRI